MKQTTFTAISEELTNRIFKSNLTMAQKTLAMYLLTKFNRKSHVVCISIRKMADDLNCSTNTTRLGVNALVKAGFIEVVKHKKKGKNGGDYQHYKLPKVHVTKEGMLCLKSLQGVAKNATESTKSVAKTDTITTCNNNRNETSSSSFETPKNDVSQQNEEEEKACRRKGKILDNDISPENTQSSLPAKEEPRYINRRGHIITYSEYNELLGKYGHSVSTQWKLYNGEDDIYIFETDQYEDDIDRQIWDEIKQQVDERDKMLKCA